MHSSLFSVKFSESNREAKLQDIFQAIYYGKYASTYYIYKAIWDDRRKKQLADDGMYYKLDFSNNKLSKERGRSGS